MARDTLAVTDSAETTAMDILQRTPEWYAARRELITSTDIPIIMGLSPYKSEAELAREKAGEDIPEPDPATARRYRLGQALETIVAAEDEVEHGIPLVRMPNLITNHAIPWAGASLDFERDHNWPDSNACIVETKVASGKRWADGLPQDVEAQVRWQMGVTGYSYAHVAALRYGSDLECHDLEHDQSTFEHLLTIAEDFRRRLREGGPFRESLASIKSRYPFDSGETITADDELAEAVRALVNIRAHRKELEQQEGAVELAIKSRMGEAARLEGDGFHVTWKRTKDVSTTDWKSIADGLLRQLPEEQREPLVSIHTTVREGYRPFRVVVDKETE